MISKTNCTLLANEKTMFNENIYEPTEFAVCYEPRAIRALRCATKLSTFAAWITEILGVSQKMASYKI